MCKSKVKTYSSIPGLLPEGAVCVSRLGECPKDKRHSLRQKSLIFATSLIEGGKALCNFKALANTSNIDPHLQANSNIENAKIKRERGEFSSPRYSSRFA